MVCQFQPVTYGHTPNVVTRALHLPEVQDAIISRCDSRTHRALKQLNKNWYQALQTPRIWTKTYHPAAIQTRLRLVASPARPELEGEIQLFYQPVQKKRPTHLLGVHDDKPWRLLFGAPVKKVYSPVSREMLAHVSALGRPGSMSNLPFSALPPKSQRSRVKLEEAQSYAFLQDRAYRLNNNLPIPIWGRSQNDALYALSLFGALFTVLTVHAVLSSVDTHMPFWQGQSALSLTTLSRTLREFGIPRILVCWSAGACFVAFIGGRFMESNNIYTIVGAPITHQRLNLWALHLLDLEQAEKDKRRRGDPKDKLQFKIAQTGRHGRC